MCKKTARARFKIIME